MPRTPPRSETGSTLVASLFATVTLAGFAVALLGSVTSTNNEHTHARDRLLGLNLAEAGANRALADLRMGNSGNLGNAAAPVAFGAGTFWTATRDNGDQTFTITATGDCQGQTRVLQAIVRETGGIFANAVFAGNDSNDPNYSMRFGGSGSQADYIDGDIYSGGGVTVAENADITGTIRSAGTIVGGSGEEGLKQPVPDIAGMAYESNHDINVAAQFAANQSWQSDSAGGSAYQVPSSLPSHIFRKNPSDRTTETSSTSKDDYFLEDPYESVDGGSSSTGSDAYHISTGSAGHDKVFFIDGNLWIHNKQTLGLKFEAPSSDGFKATFVVKGNIYISDNLFYENDSRDGVAFIAMKDSGVADSGNIYFGDPRYGTLERMQAFMYAENNFYDNNLDESGSARVILDGTMSAGNQVAINRDWGSQHSKLTVNLDDRVMSGQLELPGIPSQQSERQYNLVTWREISLYANGGGNGGITTTGNDDQGSDGGTSGDSGSSGSDSSGSGSSDSGSSDSGRSDSGSSDSGGSDGGLGGLLKLLFG